MLASEIVGDAVRRGHMQMTEAAALFASARQNLHKIAPLFPGDPMVMRIAEESVALVERMVRAYSAEMPDEGPH